jgi:hypothetical protein
VLEYEVVRESLQTGLLAVTKSARLNMMVAMRATAPARDYGVRRLVRVKPPVDVTDETSDSEWVTFRHDFIILARADEL